MATSKAKLASHSRPDGKVPSRAWGGSAVVVAVMIAAVIWYVSRPTQNATAPAVSVFAPTQANFAPPPGPVPEGMVWVPGGEFSMGSVDPRATLYGGPDAMRDARPVHRVYVDGFWMDATEVTNEQFEQFVTGYRLCHHRRAHPDAGGVSHRAARKSRGWFNGLHAHAQPCAAE